MSDIKNIINPEDDLNFACLQKINGVPTREQIVEQLPPLGRAALSYNPEKDDFFVLMEEYGVPLTDEEYISFVTDLFFNMLAAHYTGLGTEPSVIRETFNARSESYWLWYEHFGFKSKKFQNIHEKVDTSRRESKGYSKLMEQLSNESSTSYGYHLHKWFMECYRKIMGSDSYSIYRQADKKEQLAMADDFFESLPYNTGRLINKLIIEITGESVLLPFRVRDIMNGQIDISNNQQFPIYVYSHICHCIKCEQKHGVPTICDRQALVQTLTGKWVAIAIQYCQGCNKGFINQEILDSYRKKFGDLLFERYYSESNMIPLGTNKFGKDSILSRCGYSVEKGTTKESRQTILAYILDSKKATKAEIQELISFFIQFHKQPQFANARQCWREDLFFVVNYEIETQSLIGRANLKKP